MSSRARLVDPDIIRLNLHSIYIYIYANTDILCKLNSNSINWCSSRNLSLGSVQPEYFGIERVNPKRTT